MVNLTDDIGVRAILFLRGVISKPETEAHALKIWQSMTEEQKVLIYDCYIHVRNTKLQGAIK